MSDPTPRGGMVVVRGTKVFHTPCGDKRVQVSRQAQKLITEFNLKYFADSLFIFMEKTRFTWAYVGREGNSIRVNFGR